MRQFWDENHPWQPHIEIWGATVHHQDNGCMGYPNIALHLADMPGSIAVEATAMLHRAGMPPPPGPAIDLATPHKYESRSWVSQPHPSYLLVEKVFSEMAIPTDFARRVTLAVYPTVGTYAAGNDEPLELVRRMDLRRVFGGLRINREEPIRKACVSVLLAVHRAVRDVL
jgi:hypothetical protein